MDRSGDALVRADADRQELRTALDLVATIEERSRMLRRPRTAQPQPVGLAAGLRIAVRDDPTISDRVPAGLAETDLQPLAGAPPILADAVALAKLPRAVLRLRAFYFERGLTLAAHARLPLRRAVRPRLLTGAAAARQARPGDGLAIPRVIETGRGLRRAWVVEELLVGRAVPLARWPTAAAAVVAGLAPVWTSDGLRSRPLDRVLSTAKVAVLRDLLRQEAMPQVSTGALLERVDRLLGRAPQVAVGWTHGDPVRGNCLALADGRIALVDWESAGWRPAAWDVAKLLVGVTDPGSVVARMEELVPDRRGTAPWREQIAVAYILWLSAWRTEQSSQRRLHQRIALLDQLLRNE